MNSDERRALDRLSKETEQRVASGIAKGVADALATTQKSKESEKTGKFRLFARWIGRWGGRTLGVLNLIILVAYFSGELLPREPIFGLPPPSNSQPNKVSFEIKNPSALFSMKDMQLDCYVHVEQMVPLAPGGPFGATVSQSQFIEEVGDIGREENAQGLCSKFRPKGEMTTPQIESNGTWRTPRPDEFINITRLWVRARYQVSLFSLGLWYWTSSPSVFNWQELDPPRWVRGDQHEPSVLEEHKEPPYDWKDVRRSYEEEQAKKKHTL